MPLTFELYLVSQDESAQRQQSIALSPKVIASIRTDTRRIVCSTWTTFAVLVTIRECLAISWFDSNGAVVVSYSCELAERIRRVVVRPPRWTSSSSAARSRGVRLRSRAAAAAVVVEPRPHELQQQAVDRAGEGVPLQPLPDARAPHRDRRRAAAQRDAGQDLVPEPSHEAEEATETPPAAAAAAGGGRGSFYRVRVFLDARAAGRFAVRGIVDVSRPRPTVVTGRDWQLAGPATVTTETPARRTHRRHVAKINASSRGVPNGAINGFIPPKLQCIVRQMDRTAICC